MHHKCCLSINNSLNIIVNCCFLQKYGSSSGALIPTWLASIAPITCGILHIGENRCKNSAVSLCFCEFYEFLACIVTDLQVSLVICTTLDFLKTAAVDIALFDEYFLMNNSFFIISTGKPKFLFLELNWREKRHTGVWLSWKINLTPRTICKVFTIESLLYLVKVMICERIMLYGLYNFTFRLTVYCAAINSNISVVYDNFSHPQSVNNYTFSNLGWHFEPIA